MLSQKYPYSPQGRSLESSRGRGSSKPNFYKKSMKLNLNFLGGEGVQNKLVPSLGGGGGEGNVYFLKLHIIMAIRAYCM